MNAQRSLPRPPSRIFSAREIVEIVYRQKYVFLAVFVLAMLAMFAFGLWTPTYEAQMKILVHRQRADTVINPSASGNVDVGSDQVTEEDLNSEVELLNSRDLLREVASSTNLGNSAMSHFLSPGSPDMRLAKAVYKLGKDLKIEPIRKSDVIAVRYQAPIRNPPIECSRISPTRTSRSTWNCAAPTASSPSSRSWPLNIRPPRSRAEEAYRLQSRQWRRRPAN